APGNSAGTTKRRSGGIGPEPGSGDKSGADSLPVPDDWPGRRSGSSAAQTAVGKEKWSHARQAAASAPETRRALRGPIAVVGRGGAALLRARSIRRGGAALPA